MSKKLSIITIILGFVIFIIGIALLICSGLIVFNMFNLYNFQPMYAFVRDETVKGIQTAGKLCAVFGGAATLVGLFSRKKEEGGK